MLNTTPYTGPRSEEGYVNFTFETCKGLIRPTHDCYYLLWVQNTSPGNGSFEQLMAYLEDRTVIVQHVWNASLRGRLVVRGYERINEWGRNYINKQVKYADKR